MPEIVGACPWKRGTCHLFSHKVNEWDNWWCVMCSMKWISCAGMHPNTADTLHLAISISRLSKIKVGPLELRVSLFFHWNWALWALHESFALGLNFSLEAEINTSIFQIPKYLAGFRVFPGIFSPSKRLILCIPFCMLEVKKAKRSSWH